ncbi:hypothetical protein BDN67DRAFT_985051 [Paxillus ammoniavirescens]|nr:hypothetical protein BDN67DRAFT_985051 [Paxillus ammoniavirescens]
MPGAMLSSLKLGRGCDWGCQCQRRLIKVQSLFPYQPMRILIQRQKWCRRSNERFSQQQEGIRQQASWHGRILVKNTRCQQPTLAPKLTQKQFGELGEAITTLETQSAVIIKRVEEYRAEFQATLLKIQQDNSALVIYVRGHGERNGGA